MTAFSLRDSSEPEDRTLGNPQEVGPEDVAQSGNLGTTIPGLTRMAFTQPAGLDVKTPCRHLVLSSHPRFRSTGGVLCSFLQEP